MADQTKEMLAVFNGANKIFNVSDVQRFVTEVRGFSKLAGDMRTKVDRIRNDLEVSASVQYSGGRESKYGVPKDTVKDSVAGAKGKKTDQTTSSANSIPSPTPDTAASVDANKEANRVSTPSASATVPSADHTIPSATVPDADHTTDAVPAETGKGSAASCNDADGWICASCTFRNQPTADECEKCSTKRNAYEMLKSQLEAIKHKTDHVRPPSNWLPVDPGILAKRVKLVETDEDYLKVTKAMSCCFGSHPFFSLNTLKRIFGYGASSAGLELKKIERIENLRLYQMYSIRKSQMDDENLSVVENERMLWHGTAYESIDNIASNGFNRSLCGKNGTWFGKGVYFSEAPCYSSLPIFATPDKSGIQHMFYCRVLTGRFTVGKKGMVEPPVMLNGLGRYNSLANCDVSPCIFVIFHDAQAYPEFLVTFKRLD